MWHEKKMTTKAVWDAIFAAHRDQLGVFSSFSNPDGEFMGFSGRGEMATEYGFHGAEAPLIGCRTTWMISDDGLKTRGPEVHVYWLCVACDEMPASWRFIDESFPPPTAESP